MATYLQNQNQWYDVASSGPYTSTISGYNVNWTNVIQARWTSLSGSTYYTEYRAIVRKSGGSNFDNTSSYNGYAIGGSGSSGSSASNVTIRYPSVGDNVIVSTSGSVNGTSGSVWGGVKLGYYGTTWGATDLSATITLPELYTKPAVPTVSVSSKTDTTVTFSVAVSDYGNPASASGRYIEAELSSVAQYDSGDASKRRHNSKSNVSSATITVGNSSSSGGTLDIASNTKYYYGAYATNTKMANWTPDATMANNTVITLPAAPTASNFTVVDAGAASFKVTDASSGSAASVQLQYRYKPANDSFTSWTNAGATGNKQTRTVSLTGLDSNTAYTVEVRATTSAGTSTTTSYANAFTTSKVTVSITSQTDAVSSTAGKVDRTMKFSFGTVSTSGTVYQYEYQYKKSSTSTWNTAVTGTSSSTTKSIVLTLDQGTTYDFRIHARISGGIDEPYGDYATAQFTTTSYQPGVPIIEYRFDDIRSKVYVDITPNGLVSSITCKVSGGSPSFNLINSTKSTTGAKVTFEANLLRNSQVITPLDVANFTITATQTYSSNTTTATANMPTPWRIVGVIKKPNGNKMNIIRVRIKDKNGTLTAGDPKHPFVTK